MWSNFHYFHSKFQKVLGLSDVSIRDPELQTASFLSPSSCRDLTSWRVVSLSTCETRLCLLRPMADRFCLSLSFSSSLSSRVVLLLSRQRHDGLPLPLPPLPWLPALPELLLARQRQRLTQQPASDEGALVLGESECVCVCDYSFITPGGTTCVYRCVCVFEIIYMI